MNVSVTCIILLAAVHLSVSQPGSEKPAFSVSLAYHQLPNYGGQVARFDTVHVDIPGHSYNTGTGVFAAPEQGTYVFNVSALKYLKGNKMFVRLRHNNKDVASLYSDSAGNGQNISHTVILYLERGDQVWVFLDTNGETEDDCGLNGNGYSTFSGFML
ncbi:complement C1q tumor necrosis factor-related protein 3-like [Amphiura filiformis]|uniref:complement C1q tumor necrosis factor-related protein 3-like n=1 Tax=Amphiura filiformis TaxID=82378 RepID=UPI003B228269